MPKKRRKKIDYDINGCLRFMAETVVLALDDYKMLCNAGLVAKLKRIRSIKDYQVYTHDVWDNESAKIKGAYGRDLDIDELLYFLKDKILVEFSCESGNVYTGYKTFIRKLLEWEEKKERKNQ